MSEPTNSEPPMVGDIVLYRMPDEWHPELGIRVYPAVVLYPNGGYGVGGVDLQVFCQPYEGGRGYHVSARRGDGPGEWRPKQAHVDQQPIIVRSEPEPVCVVCGMEERFLHHADRSAKGYHPFREASR